ncbi:MAG: pyridoxine 5'-phosphate synthase [Solirubrobacteraceae bacterium]
MINLSVNINKIATIRNARGGNKPNLVEAAIFIQAFGAQGITIHPRPDERHIKYQDVYNLKPVVYTEFNIEGNPAHKSFIDLVLEIKPTQVTLVPDTNEVLTSNAGWDTVKHLDFLKEVIQTFKEKNIRTSIFLDPNINFVKSAKKTGADRIELYTESYASAFEKGNKQAIKPYLEVANLANEIGLEINAGHDLSLKNIGYFIETIPFIKEVSIGHALISEALYLGLNETIKQYLAVLK